MSLMRSFATTLLAVGICVACASSHESTRPLRVTDSYLGLDCGDAFPCPHLGIAIWLAAPAFRVAITLHGRRVTLATHRKYEYRRYWQGFVRDAAAERLAGNMSRTVRLGVDASRRDGTVRRATLTSPVNPGWG